jgi:hypothetical protein
MLTTTSPEFTNWKRDLVDFGFKEAHVNDSLIAQLSAHDIEPIRFMDDQFRGYYYGDTEEEAGSEAVKEWVELGSWQEFIEDHIDWYAAWKTLESKARLALVKVSEHDWVLIAK